MATILYIDDEPSVGVLLQDSLTRAGHRAVGAQSVGEALQVLARGRVDLILSDSRMPGLTSAEFVALLAREGFDVPLIMLTADEDGDAAASSALGNVVDCLTKPIRSHQLELSVRRAVERSALRRENETLRREVIEARTADRTIGESEAIRHALEIVAAVGPTRSSVLLQGESGTGRKVFARAIHDHGAHANQPFIKLNCAALPDSLIESAILGHERGAFTGAIRRVEGAFERTSGGTLVLEEVEALAPEFQARLLQILEKGEFTRMGGTHPIPVDVRLISTATRRLSEEVANGRFLEGLYRKLAAVVIELPALRERREDIPALARHFTQVAASEVEKPVPTIAPDAIAILRDYGWPGNVRELRHAIERAVILSQEPTLHAHLFEQERGMQNSSLVQQVLQRGSGYHQPALNVGLHQPPATPPSGIVLTTLNVEEAERALIKRALEVAGGNRTRTAELLGISVRTLRNKLNGPQRVTLPG